MKTMLIAVLLLSNPVWSLRYDENDRESSNVEDRRGENDHRIEACEQLSEKTVACTKAVEKRMRAGVSTSIGQFTEEREKELSKCVQLSNATGETCDQGMKIFTAHLRPLHYKRLAEAKQAALNHVNQTFRKIQNLSLRVDRFSYSASGMILQMPAPRRGNSAK